MHKRFFLSTLWCIILCSGALTAQEEADEQGMREQSFLQKQIVLPTTPEAASLGKFGDFPVNYHTGTVNTTIPLHTMGGKEVSMPVTLAYDASGNKVEDLGTWVGLGWRLNAGGVITRATQGNPDRYFNYFSQNYNISNNSGAGSNQIALNDHYYQVIKGYIETQPDFYFFNFGGFSGKFYITPGGLVVFDEVRDSLNVNFTISNGDIGSFTITDPNGTQYLFNTTETSNLLLDDDNQYLNFPAYLFPSSWYLTRITGANGAEVIDLTYESMSTDFQPVVNTFQYQSLSYYGGELVCSTYPCGSPGSVSSAYGGINSLTIQGRKFLQNATYKINGVAVEQLEFQSSAGSTVNSYMQNGKKLDKILIKSGVNAATLIKQWAFTYDNSTNRLTLKSLQEQSAGTAANEPYSFTYNSTPMPIPTSNAIDHWGYYNGAANDFSLIPSFTDPNSGIAYAGGGANRETNPSYVTAALMTRITYPTKGYSEFTYEANVVAGATPADPDRTVGGCRIKQIKNYDAGTALLTTRTFNYVKEGNNPVGFTSSGKLYTNIIYNSGSSNIHYGTTCTPPGGTCSTEGETYTCSYLRLSAVSQTPVGAQSRNNIIGYARVEEVFSGKSVYWFGSNNGNGDDEKPYKTQHYDAAGKLLYEKTTTWGDDSRRRQSYTAYVIKPKVQQTNRVLMCYQLCNGVYSYQWYRSSCDFYCGGAASQPNCVQSKIFKSRFDKYPYSLTQTWLHPTQEEEKSYFYDQVGVQTGVVSKITTFSYDNKCLDRPTQVLFTNSDNKVFKTVTRYAHDVNNTALVNKWMIGLPLEHEVYTDNVLVYNTRLEYSPFSTTTGLPGSGTFLLPYRYYERFNSTQSLILRETIEKYDAATNVVQAKREHDQSFSLRWSHNASRMAARILNAMEGETAYTSFEVTEANTGGWVVSTTANYVYDNASLPARTGKGCWGGASGNIQKTALPAGKYVLSYYKTGSGSIALGGVTALNTQTSPADAQNWTLAEITFNAAANATLTLTLTGTAYLDEVRLCPADALMTSYTYDRDTRLLTAISDESNTTASIDYDPMLRLESVRNFDKHILKAYEYLYKNAANTENAVKTWEVQTSGQSTLTAVKALTGANVKPAIAYFDGLGRPKQSIGLWQSPAMKDVVSFNVYDAYGREPKKYLPYTVTNTNGAIRNNPLTEQAAFYNGLYPTNGSVAWEETEFDNSPLNRVTKIKPAGADFAAKPVRTEYNCNAANEVRNFRQAGGFYPAASLLKTTTYDENNNAAVAYRDKAGRKVMTETAGRKTYYLYDDFGNTVQVIPPVPAALGHTTTGNIHTTATISNQSFRYTYDANTMLMTDKYVPGLNTTNKYFYAYDRLERPVMVTDAKGFKIVTKYDILNRPVLTGRYTGTATPQPTDGLYENKTATGHFYTTNLSFPATLTDVYTVNYYDNYDFDDNNSANVAYTAAPAGTPYATSAYLAVRGKMTGSKAGILKLDQTAPTQFLASYSFYDKWGRVIHIRADHHLGATPDLIWNAYNFQGWPTHTRKAHAATVGAVNHNYIVNERFTYDHTGRLVNSYHKMGDTGTEVRVVNNTYNELGQLAVKKMHESATANTFLQDVDYTYNIRGWIEQINDFSTAADLFALKLTYKEGDAALDAAYAGGANANYNGNITMLEWKASGSATRRVQGFRYDGLNRLSNVQYAERNGGTLTVNQNHNETLTYDDNGNILGLTRRGLLSGTSTFGLIDNLTYSYTNNRLSSIAEGASTTKGYKTGGAYGYDANGNMTTDAGKGMTVSYNFLNLPQYIAFNSGSEITLTYTATGQKLTKVSGTTTKHYANGIEYNNTALEAVYFAEGRVVPGSPWKYQYTLKDHLGNGRVWFEPNAANTAPVVTQQSHYYAFGMEMEALTSAAAPNKYRYNGKELNEDFGWGWYAYGARFYDPVIARFTGVDPISDKFPWVSTYNYAENEPIASVDLHGLQRYIVTNQYDDNQRIAQTTITTVQNGSNLVNLQATNANGRVQSDVLTFNKGNLPLGVPASQSNANLSANENAIINAGIDNTRNFVNSNNRSDRLASVGGFVFPGSIPPEGGSFTSNQYVGNYDYITQPVQMTPARNVNRAVAQNFGFVVISPSGNMAGPFLTTGITNRGGSTASVVGSVVDAANGLRGQGATLNSVNINVAQGPGLTPAHITSMRDFASNVLIPDIIGSTGINRVNLNFNANFAQNNIVIRGILPAVVQNITTRVLRP